MTTSIKVVTAQEAKDTIQQLFGDISLADVKVVHLADEELQLNSSVKLGSMDDFRKNLQISLNREVTTDDVAVINTKREPSFKVSKTTAAGIAERFKELGIDLSGLKVAVVTAAELGLTTENTQHNSNKLK